MLMKMHAAGWSFVFALCFICVSLNDEKSCGHFEDFCEKISMTVSIGTSVLLPCNLQPHSSNWVTWSHAATKQAEMVQLSSQGHVNFLDPRNGRVKVFSNEQRDGNYSIRNDELEKSDLGCYHCGRQCVQVQLPETGLSSSQGFQPLISIVTRVAAVLLLCVGGYCCYKCISHCNNKTKDSANSPTTAGSEGAEK